MAKGRGKGKPSVKPKTIQPTQPLASSSPANAHQAGKNTTTPKPPKVSLELLRDPVWQLAGVVLSAILLLISFLWVEIRSHTETKEKLAREEKAKTDATAERDQARTERDQARKGIEDLQKENAELKRLHPILEFYGPRAKLVTSYDLNKEAGSFISIGPCPAPPCYRLTLLGIQKKDGVSVAVISLSEAWNVAERGLNQIQTGLPLKRGCSVTFQTSQYDITFAIEDDRIDLLRAGVGLSPGTHFGGGFRFNPKKEDC